jgi:hypothetical protein
MHAASSGTKKYLPFSISLSLFFGADHVHPNRESSRKSEQDESMFYEED